VKAALVDTHCHLDFDRYEGELDAILARAAEAGVTQMVTIGCAQTVENAGRALALAERHPSLLRATIGIHPHDADRSSDALLAEVERLAAHPRIVALGEMGLDFYYDNAPRDAQRESFRAQIAIAKRAKKPIVVHTRDAPDETLAILREEGAKDVGGIIHCFSEDAAFARAALDLGFVSSFSGLVTFPRGTEGIRDAARTQPADAILVETDAPFLAPVPHRGKRNEPAYVAHTAAFVAALRGEDEDAFRARTTENARRVLSL
jgi:TatD DNase family protein